MGVDRQRVKAMDPSHFFAPSAVKQSPSLQKKKIDSLLTQPDSLCKEERKWQIKGQRMRNRGLRLPRIWAEAAHWPGSHTDTLLIRSKKKKGKKTLHMWPWVMAFHQTPNKGPLAHWSDGRSLEFASVRLIHLIITANHHIQMVTLFRLTPYSWMDMISW